MKFKDLKFKHELFVRIDMMNSYFSKISYFVCNFFVVKLFCLPKIISCLCCS